MTTTETTNPTNDVTVTPTTTQPSPPPPPPDQPQPTPAPPQQPAPAQEPPPPDGTDWKAEARKWESRAKENSAAAAKLAEFEKAQLTDQERLQADLEAARTEHAAASTDLLRLNVALDKAPAGMDPARIRKLAGRLRGATVEELEADAVDLFAEMAASTSAPVSGQKTPVQHLRPGNLPTPQEPSIPEQIVAAEAAGEWEKADLLKAVQIQQISEQSKT